MHTRTLPSSTDRKRAAPASSQHGIMLEQLKESTHFFLQVLAAWGRLVIVFRLISQLLYGNIHRLAFTVIYHLFISFVLVFPTAISVRLMHPSPNSPTRSIVNYQSKVMLTVN